MKRLRLLFLGVIAFAAFACGGGEEAPPAPPRETPAPTPEPTPAATPKPDTPPAPGDAALDLAAGNAETGQSLYLQYCASCHGDDGKAQTPLAANLDPRPADHSAGSYMNPLSDEHLFKVVKFGGTAVDRSPLMAPWGGTLSDAEIVDVIAFVRSLADPPYTP